MTLTIPMDSIYSTYTVYLNILASSSGTLYKKNVQQQQMYHKQPEHKKIKLSSYFHFIYRSCKHFYFPRRTEKEIRKKLYFFRFFISFYNVRCYTSLALHICCIIRMMGSSEVQCTYSICIQDMSPYTKSRYFECRQRAT